MLETELCFQQKPAVHAGARGSKSKDVKPAEAEESKQLRTEMEQYIHNEMSQMRVSYQQEIARLEAKQTEEVTRLNAEQTSLKAEIKALRAEQQKGKECATLFIIMFSCILNFNAI